MSAPLAGRVVVLTGASSGLGARWGPALAVAGASLVLFARRSDELAEVAAAAGGAVVVPGDLTSVDDRRRLVAAAMDAFGRVDVLINNAGTAMSAPALATSAAQFRDMLEVDLVAPFDLTREIGEIMIAQGSGSIINISSLSADRCLDRYPLAAYSAAKSGLVALTRCLASEWGSHGVRVNAVGPAFFPTRLAGYLEDPDQVEWIKSHVALRRTAGINELDGTIVFLSSDASSYVTGQHLVVDGGWSIY